MTFKTFANVSENAGATISFEISDDESDCDRSCTSVRTLLLIRRHTKGSGDGTNTIQDSPRCIAGTRRVSSYNQKKGLLPTTTAAEPSCGITGQLLQSITAIPALADRSFEEIRLECYNQSVVATGKPPQAVNAVLNPSAVIPPLFMPVRDSDTEDQSLAITMANV